tara:strand:- start:20802 stop:21257 length:456 start_codon:yes stop_codon:yes gene_type:complete
MVQIHSKEKMILNKTSIRVNKSHIRSKRIKKLQGNNLENIGNKAIVVSEKGFLDIKQLDSVRSVLRKRLKKQAKITTTLYLDTPITKKPNEVRLGKGKGNIAYWVSVVSPGHVILTVNGQCSNLTPSFLNNVRKKLRMKSFVSTKSLRWIL